MSYVPEVSRPVFSSPVRWALRVLAWAAFGVSAYLAWHAATGSSVAGCGIGANNGCDVVLTSSWSKWLDGLDVPVAVLGLAWYASLATLSVLLGVRNAGASRWISTAFVMLSTVAAGASLWFIGIQIFAIGDFCPYCIITDVCGILIGGLAIGSVLRWLYARPRLPHARTPDASLFALRAGLPAAARPQSAPIAIAQPSPRPSLPIALGGAVALLAFFIGGQVIYPSKTYSREERTLQEPIELVGTTEPQPTDQAQNSDARPHVTMRIPSESGESERATDGDEDSGKSEIQEDVASTEAATSGRAEPSTVPAADAPTASADPTVQPKRLVKFLNGTLTIDVYKHPLIGSPEAPHVMIEMVSYNCAHCRKMHSVMEKGLARYGDQLAIIVMPVPLEMDCNKLITDSRASHRGACATARYVLGVATLQPQSFHKFHNWLMSGDKEKPPTVEKVIPKAAGTVDRDRLRTLTRSEQINKQITGYINLFAKLRDRPGSSKEFGLPVQILGDHVLSGMVEKDNDVFAAWEEHLGVNQAN